MNNVSLMGHVGQAPQIKKTDSTTIANFSVATKGYKDATDWHNCVAFGKTAEIIEQFVTSGDLIAIEGSLRTEKYEDKYYTKVIVNRFHFGSSKKNRDEAVDSSTTESAGKEPDSDDLPF